MMKQQLLQKLGSKIQVDNKTNCWNWLGLVNNNGYGSFHGEMVHRFIYVLFRGKISKGYDIHHLCKNKICLNPNHLQLITRSQHQRLENPLIIEQVKKLSCPKCGGNYTNQNGHRRCMKCKKEYDRKYHSGGS